VVGGILLFVLIAGAWGLAFTGFPYAIALRTGNPTAVNNAFLLFFPFAFLTTAYLPQQAMTGWPGHRDEVQPHHLPAGRDAPLLQTGWQWGEIGKGLLANRRQFGALSFFLAFSALRGRVNRS